MSSSPDSINVKAKTWKGIFYPESAPSNWKEIIEESGIPVVVSPLHDSDVENDGSGKLKKAHYHFIEEFDGPTTYAVARCLAVSLGVSYVMPVRSRKRDERYLCHLDSVAKAQYDVADILTFGGYECKYLGDKESMNTIKMIHDLVEELGIVYYADLANEIVERYPELLTTLLRYPAHFNNFCYSRERIVKRDNGSYVKLGYTATRTAVGRSAENDY